MLRTLRVLLDGRHLATVAEPRTNKFTLTYVTRSEGETPLSLVLPWSADRHPPGLVNPWLCGLLPSKEKREVVAIEIGAPPHLVFPLLAHLGHDLPGGIVIEQPPSTDSAPIQPRPLDDLTDAEIQAEMDDEVDVVIFDRQWAFPAPGQPSTHRLRLEDELLPGAAVLEAFSLSVAHHAGLATAAAETTEVLDVPALAVARIDRQVADGEVHRLHMESFAQLCGVDLSSDADTVYEQNGGPGFHDIAAAITDHASDPVAELMVLARWMVMHVVVGNTNAHTGTYRLLLPERTLAPTDALFPATAYSELVAEDGVVDIDHRLAMSVGGRRRPHEVDHRSLVREAASWKGMDNRRASAVIDEFVAVLPAAIDAAQSSVPGTPSAFVDRVGHRALSFLQTG